MTVKLNCSSSGSVALSAPASTALGADVVLNLPSHAGSLDRLERAGNILQVIQATTSTELVTNTTGADTGLTAAIAPSSASSKILVIIDQGFYVARSSATAAYQGVKILRNNTTEIYKSVGDSDGNFDYGIQVGNATSIGVFGRIHLQVLDSPSTTGAVTYKTFGRSYGGGSAVTYQYNVTGSTNEVQTTSIISLIEVAG